MLATSRQALGVAGEVRMVVPPMSLPAEGEDTSVQRLLGYDAVWLLTERAAAVVPGFTVDAANAEQVLLLCRKLDGIPLALELAAVRLASLSLEQLNEGLSSPIIFRTRAAVARFFGGLELVEPGLVSISQWRSGAGAGASPLANWAGVARKT